MAQDGPNGNGLRKSFHLGNLNHSLVSDETDLSNLPKEASKTHRLKIIRENTVFTGCTVNQDAPSYASDSPERTPKGTMNETARVLASQCKAE